MQLYFEIGICDLGIAAIAVVLKSIQCVRGYVCTLTPGKGENRAASVRKIRRKEKSKINSKFPSTKKQKQHFVRLNALTCLIEYDKLEMRIFWQITKTNKFEKPTRVRIQRQNTARRPVFRHL